MRNNFPILKSIDSFCEEIRAIVDKINDLPGVKLRNRQTLDRIQELVATWSIIFGSNSNLTSKRYYKIQNFLNNLAKNTAKDIAKTKFKTDLGKALRGLAEYRVEIANDYTLLTSTDNSIRKTFIETIPDVPIELFPKDLIGWKNEIEAFLKKNPFDQNIFIIVRYAKESEKIISEVVSSIKKFELNDQKFNPIIARDTQITDTLTNPIACLLCCRYAIAIFDSVDNKPEINPNVAYEVGFVHLLQRKFLLLKDSELKSMPTDILHKLYVPYSNPNEANTIITDWLITLAS